MNHLFMPERPGHQGLANVCLQETRLPCIFALMRSTLVGYSVPDVKSQGVAGPLVLSCNSERYDPCVLACHCGHIHGVYTEHIRFSQCKLRECVQCKSREAISPTVQAQRSLRPSAPRNDELRLVQCQKVGQKSRLIGRASSHGSTRGNGVHMPRSAGGRRL